MKHLTLFVIFCIVLTSSCTNKQNIEEKKILTQFGDSCVNRLCSSIKNKFYQAPPPPPIVILGFFDDTVKAKLELNRLDTLGYPLRFSVLNFKIKNDSSVTEYYKAFAQQNDVRLNYINENIIICDTLLIPNSVLLAKAVRNNDTLIKEFSIDSSESTAQELLNNKPKGLSWDKDKQHKYSKFIADLKPTSIQFYRIIFNKTKTKGMLLYHFTIWGYLDGDACFYLENQKSNWSIKHFNKSPSIINNLTPFSATERCELNSSETT